LFALNVNSSALMIVNRFSKFCTSNEQLYFSPFIS
jgi:hypothetical protein